MNPITTDDRIVAAGEGRQLRFGPNRISVKVGPDNGSQQLAIFESVLPPQAGVFPHLHRRFEETFYCLEGEIEIRVGDEKVIASAGMVVFIPVGVVHAFKNVGAIDGRLLVIHATPRAIDMVDELGRSRPDQIGEVLSRYDSELAQ